MQILTLKLELHTLVAFLLTAKCGNAIRRDENLGFTKISLYAESEFLVVLTRKSLSDSQSTKGRSKTESTFTNELIHRNAHLNSLYDHTLCVQ